MAKQLKNVVLAYHGGGYDGCIWEWNCCLFDWAGNFHNLHSTGCSGIRDADEARERTLAALNGEPIDSHDHIVRLNNVKSVKHFNKEYATGLVVGTMFKAQQIYERAPRPVQKRLRAAILCDACGCDTHKEDLHYVDYRSQGGIVIAAHTKVCQECFDEGACRKCVESGVDDDHAYEGKENLDKHGLCEHCAPFRVLELLDEGRVKLCAETAEIHEIWDAKRQGERQYRQLIDLAEKPWGPMSRALHKTHSEGCNRMDAEIVELWRELTPDEREALTLDYQPVTSQDNQPTLALA